jgi:hypothetical protein
MTKILIDVALRLAEKLDRTGCNDWLALQAATELRRLHAENQALRQALSDSVEQPAREPIKWADYEPDGVLRKPFEERLKDAFYEGFTSSATYNDIKLNDVDEEWLEYAAAHGITKGNT